VVVVAMAALFLWQASVAIEKYQSKVTTLQVFVFMYLDFGLIL
jgi:hypothetical protein